jgi:uncharacterized protein (DUF433 family)
MPKEIAPRITIDPNVMVGKPVVKGTRIPVELVIEQLAFNPDINELFAAYPHLTMEDVKACLAYAQKAVAAKRPKNTPLPPTDPQAHP